MRFRLLLQLLATHGNRRRQRACAPTHSTRAALCHQTSSGPGPLLHPPTTRSRELTHCQVLTWTSCQPNLLHWVKSN